MRLNHWYRVACLALILPIMGAAGCTGTDMLAPTTGNVRFEVDVVNVPPDFRFETARFRIRQVTVRPVGTADQVLGTDSIGLIQSTSAITINFNLTEPQNRVAPLPTGTYALENFLVGNFRFRDTDAPPDPEPPDVTCAEYVPEYTSPDTQAATIYNFGRDVTINVTSAQENVVHVVVDWSVFTEAMQTSWACQQFGDCGEFNTWCLLDFGLGFNESTFNDYAPDFISIN